jgi:Radical SAM superfamily./Glycosyl transferase family 2.
MNCISMNQNISTFEIFLRKGFDNSGNIENASYLNSLDSSFKVSKYRLDSPFNKLIQEIRTGDSPFIIFADDIVKLPPLEAERLEELLKINKDIAGLTFYSNELKRVYGLQDKKVLADSAAPPLIIQAIPPWFCILNREYLNQYKLLEFEYQTLEFLLLEISDSLSKTAKHILLLDSANIDMDLRLWVRDILLANSHRLASDYILFKQRHNSEGSELKIPYQFKIEISGEYVTLPVDEHDLPLKSKLSNPKFSVICPAYKSKFFEETVNSVISQTWDNWELIVVIDGPPEDEKERLVSILKNNTTDARIRFYSQQNKGTGPTRRRLAQLAKGDFVITIDDDDVFMPDVLKIFASVINRYPDVSVFRGGARLFGLVDLYLSPRQRTIVNGICSDLFEATQPFVIDRKVLIDLGGFEGDTNFREAGEDSDLFLKIDKAQLKTYLIDRSMYLRRVSTVNQTLDLRPDECMDHINCLIKRHCPTDWKFSDIHFHKDGEFIKVAISYQHDESDQMVVVATKFFDYQTLGESSHVLIDLEVTSACNSTCTFCPREEIKRNDKFISMELVNILAEQISQESGTRQVILCGIGESTLHPELEKIVENLFRAGAKVCITTNGSRMNLDKFKRLADSGIVEFNFSLNASTEETHHQVMKMNGYNRIISDLSDILDYKKKVYPDIEINVSFVLCNYNQHEVYDFVEQWRNRGISRIWIHPVNNRAGQLDKDVVNVDMFPVTSKFADDEMVVVDVFRHVLEDGNVCKIVQALDFISVDGDMLLCAMDYKRSALIGNLRDTPLRQMYLTKFLKYKRNEINNICHSCSFLPGN